MKNGTRFALALLGVAAIVLIWYFGFSGKAEGSDAPLIVKPTKGKFTVSVTTTGELQAENSIEIMGPVAARKAGLWQIKILRLVPEGTIVNKGDFVAELDKSELVSKLREVELNHQKFQSQYTQAKLDCTLTLSQARDELQNLEYAKEQRQLEKEESIYEAPSVKRQAEIEYEKAVRAYEQQTVSYRTKVRQAEAKMREVEADLFKEKQKLDDMVDMMSQFTVLAPEKGMVIYMREHDGKKRTEGGTISTWQPTVAMLPDLTRMVSITLVNEVDIQKIRQGQTVSVGLDADPDRMLQGTVQTVANIGESRPNSDGKVFEVRIRIEGSDSTLRPAMTTSNVILIEEVQEALFIPLEGLFADGKTSYVFKKVGGSTVKQEVRIGTTNENEVVIEQGLTLEDRILLSAPENAHDLEWQRL